jgi:small-conductance mechanosensitive channel
VRSDLLERIKRTLDKHGLSIPVEQRALPLANPAASK